MGSIGGTDESVNSYESEVSFDQWRGCGNRSVDSGQSETSSLNETGESSDSHWEEDEISSGDTGEEGSDISEREHHMVVADAVDTGLESVGEEVNQAVDELHASAFSEVTSFPLVSSDVSGENVGLCGQSGGGDRENDLSCRAVSLDDRDCGEQERRERVGFESTSSVQVRVGCANEPVVCGQCSQFLPGARPWPLSSSGVRGGMIARLCEGVTDAPRINFLLSVVEAYVESLREIRAAGEESKAQLVEENRRLKREIEELKAALERERQTTQGWERRTAELEREVSVSRDLGAWQVNLCEFEARLLAREQEVEGTTRERLQRCLECVATWESRAWGAVSQSSTRTSSL